MVCNYHMKIAYRPEIDGLRAIGVGAVILYHAQITIFGYQPFKGGFIGVDIFFVISGYLISKIIIKEINETKNFSIKNYFLKRSRRILPALIFISFLFLPISFIILMPGSLIEFIKSLLFSITFLSNFFFYYSGQEYGTADSLFKPFLHTWSLSLEEQFYLIAPFFLLFTLKYFKKYLLIILIIFFTISFLFANILTITDRFHSFYMIYTRFWEFTAGIILTYIERRQLNINIKFGNLYQVVGIILIFFSLIFFSNETHHPSIFTLIPVFGTCIVLLFSNSDFIITKILSSKIFKQVGLMSYSLYLTHFPIFSFGRSLSPDPNFYDKILWLILTIITSIVCYYFIENPFRYNKNKKKIFFKNVIISYVFILSVIFVTISFFDLKKTEDYSKKNVKFILDKEGFRQQWHEFKKSNYSKMNFSKNKKAKVLIVGNSHSIDTFNVLTSSTLNKSIDFATIYHNSKSYNFQVSCLYEYLKLKKNVVCNQGKKKGVVYKNLPKKFKTADVIILSTRWKEKDLSILEDLILLITQRKKEVIIFGNAFEMTYSSKNLIPVRNFVKKKLKFPDSNELKILEKQVFKRRNNKKLNYIDSKLRNISDLKNIPYVKWENLYCDFKLESCKVFTDGKYLITRDYGHLSQNGSKYLGNTLNYKIIDLITKVTKNLMIQK